MKAMVLKQQSNPAQWRSSTQRGAALVVGLVLMLILTILGISGVNTATLELTMTANSQAQQLTFQAAESGIEMALNGPIEPVAPDVRVTHAFGDGSYEVETQLRCVAITRVPGSDEGEHPSARAMHFEVTAVGRGPRNAESRLTQGFYFVVPTTALPEPEPEGSGDGGCFFGTACPGLSCVADQERRIPVRTYWRQDDIDG